MTTHVTRALRVLAPNDFRLIWRDSFLLMVMLISLAIDLPVLWYLELWPSPLFYLWPTLPSLLLAKAAFLPVDPLQLVYACVYGVLAVGAAGFWASRSLDRFVVRGELAS